MTKKEENQSVISISISKKILEKLNAGKFNKSKLIDSLLDDYFEKEEKLLKK